MSRDLRRDFADRTELLAYLQQEFPDAYERSSEVSPTIGGRREAEQRLQEIDPPQYAATRNRLNGAVTRLSAYVRHGVLSLPEIRDAALATVRRAEQAAKLVQELAWRDYWQRVYAEIGDGIWQDREPYKTGFRAQEYARELPQDVADSTTGSACIDAFSRELRDTGYLHNHARMWLAAYLVHWRHVAWQVGAHWFLEHLLDGDPASNNLSWQWVASTFSTKPYLFNRENLERNTDGIYCRACPLAGHCDFEGSYDELTRRLFPNADDSGSLAGSGGHRSGR